MRERPIDPPHRNQQNRDASYDWWKRDDRIAIGAERRPNGDVVVKQRRCPGRFETFREPDMLGGRRQPQKSIPERADRAPRMRDVRLSIPVELEEGQLNGDDRREGACTAAMRHGKRRVSS